MSTKDDSVGIIIGVKRSKFYVHYLLVASLLGVLLLMSAFGMLRIFIVGIAGGCNGLSYTMNYATSDDAAEAKKYEVVDVPTHKLKVLVDSKALFSIVGTEMDFEETSLSSEFTFNNPNSKGECGCGESFNV